MWKKFRPWRSRISSWQDCYLGNIPIKWSVSWSGWNRVCVHFHCKQRENSKYHRKKDLKQKDLQSFSTKPRIFYSSILTLSEYNAQNMWKDAQFSSMLSRSELHASVSRMYPVCSANVTHWLWVNYASSCSHNQQPESKHSAHLLHWGTVSAIRILGNVKIKLVRRIWGHGLLQHITSSGRVHVN